MKVLIIATWYPSNRDPVAGVFVRDQVRALVTRHDVAVIAPHHLSLWPGIAIGQEDGATVVRPRFLIPPIRWFGWNRVSSLLYRAEVMRAYRSLTARWGRPDVIHAHVAFPGGWCAATISQADGIPVVVTEHTSAFAKRLRPRFRLAATKWTLDNVDARIAVSEGLRAQIHEAMGVDSDIIANAFDSDFFSPDGPPHDGMPVRFLTVGILSPHKGVDILFEALRRLVDRGVDEWELVVGGDGPSRRDLEAQAARLGIAGKVRFTGRLDREAVRDWMRWSDVFVLASRHENLPGVVAEALLTDRPVIATRCGGPEYMVPPDAGLLVPVEDPDALSEALERAVRGGLRPAPGLARAHAVASFSRERFLDEIDSLYRRIAHQA